MTMKLHLAGAAVLSLGFALAGPAAAADCALVEQASLPMTVLPDGSFTVPVNVHGHTWNMKLDLSVPFASAFDDSAKPLNLTKYEIGSSKYVLYDNRMIAAKFVLPDVKAGGIKVPQMEAMAIPSDPASSITGAPPPAGVDGILGRSFLDHFDLEFDFAHARLNLFAHNPCKGHAVYWADSAAAVPFESPEGGPVLLKVDLDGKPVEASLDTMHGDSRLSLAAAEKVFGIDTGSAGMTRIAAAKDGRPSLYRYPFGKLSLGGAIFAHPAIDIAANDAMPSGGLEMRSPGDIVTYGNDGNLALGMNQLRKLRIYLSWNDHTLYMTAAGAAKPGDHPMN